MKEYDLIFVFSRTGELTLVRTMPDGNNKGLFNGLGGRTAVAEMSQFFDDVDSGLIGTVHVMDLTLYDGCTPNSQGEPILLHVEGKVYDHLKQDPKRPKAGQVMYKATYDALMESMESEMDEFIVATGPSRKYVPGYSWFLSETYAKILADDTATGRFPDFANITGCSGQYRGYIAGR